MHLQILSFFCILICSSEAIKCKHCLERNADHCKPEDTIDCVNNEEGCGSASGFIYHVKEKVKTPFFYRGCRIPIECGTWLCISINGTYWESYIGCCDGAECDLEYHVPDDANEPENGLVCESCYKEGTQDGCSSSETINCRTDETNCVDYRGKGFLYSKDKEPVETPISFKGCASPTAHQDFHLFYFYKETERKVFSLYVA